MKKIVSVVLAWMMLIGTTVTASAAEADHEKQLGNDIAYLELDEASPDMQKKILKAREQIIYNTDWVADGYNGAVMDAETGEIIEVLPHFSEIFPDWDVPTEEITEYEVDALPQIGVGPDDWLRFCSKRVYLEEASQSQNADSFETFQNDPYEYGTCLVLGATSLSSSETYNVGVTNASTGKSLLVKTRLSEGILAILDGVYDEMLSCRASTYSDPGWATMVIQGRYRVSDVR